LDESDSQPDITLLRYVYCLIFLIPVNICIIGSWMGVRIQWTVLHYQETYLGSTVFPFTRSVSWIAAGYISGKSAWSQILFIIAALILILSFVFLLSSRPAWIRRSGYLTIAAGVLFLVSDILQYGILMTGPSGTAIPVGIPLILITGYFLAVVKDKGIPPLPEKPRSASPYPGSVPAIPGIRIPALLEKYPFLTRTGSFVSDQREVLLLIGLSLLFFGKIIVNGDQMITPPGSNVGSDVVLLFSFWRSFFAAGIVHGTGLPLWNPFVFSGTPFIGNPLSAMFYPVTWLFLFLNNDTLFGYIYILDVILIGIFTFYYGREIDLSKFGALIAAISFMFCGVILPRIFAGHLPTIDAFVWFTAALLFFERSCKSGKALYGICAGIALGMMFLAGEIQIALYGASATVLYVMLRVLLQNNSMPLRSKASRLLAIMVLSIAICGAISAIQLLPTWEFSQFSNRAGGVSYDFSTEMSLPPSNMITLLIPDYFGSVGNTLIYPVYYYWEFCLYLGILPLILACAGLWFHNSRYRLILGCLALFALLFSLGTYTPVYDLFFHFVPGFSMFRKPSSMLFVFAWGVALLAGMGGDVITASVTEKEKNRFYLFRNGLLVLSFITLVFLFLTGTGWKMPSSSNELLDYYLVFSCIFFLSVIVISFGDTLGIEKGWLQRILIAIVVVDLFFFGMQFIDTRSPETVFKNPAYIPVLQNETDTYFRIYDTTQTLNQNLAYRNNLYLVNGYDPTYLKDYQLFFVRAFGKNSLSINTTWWIDNSSVTNPDILRLLNVRYIITGEPMEIPGTVCVYNDTVIVYRLNSTYPRAYIVSEKEFRNTTPLIMNPAKITAYYPNTITVDAETSEESYLVTSEIYYPGWTAQDNGRPVEILKSQGIFRSVRLSPGNHTVTFTYFPKIFTLN